MSFLGNIIWLIFGGLLTGLSYILAGGLVCLTVVGIPFGVQSINLGVATLSPFGRQIIRRQRGGGILGAIFDIIWLFLFGWEIAVAHLSSAAILAITIVGIPFAAQHIKLIPVALFPFNYELRE